MRGGILFTREFRPSKKHRISNEAKRRIFFP
jgi:hypothetical protein